MKKILTLLFVTTTSAAYAVSTCETRVDSHQKATTQQRVEYCLTEESETMAPVAGPELVYSSTYSRDPEIEESTKSTVRNGYFKENKVAIQHQYVGSRNFPAFTNDTLSEQERAEVEQAYLNELEKQRNAAEPEFVDAAAAKKATTQRAPARLDKPVKEDNLSTALTQTQEQRGLQARQQKPKRIMKSLPSNEATQTAASGVAVTPVVSEETKTQETVVNSTDPLLSSNPYNEDDLLQDELGIADEPLIAPIPPTVNQK